MQCSDLILPRRDFGLVLQGTDDEEGVTNAVMASAPGHPVWAVLQRDIQRTVETDPVMDRELGPKDVIRVSGPQTLAKAFREVFNVVSVCRRDCCSPAGLCPAHVDVNVCAPYSLLRCSRSATGSF